MIPGANPLLVLAVVLAAGALFGALAKRAKLPSVTGQILAGILIGPSVLGVFGHDAVGGLAPVNHFALGLIAVTVGSHLNVRRLRSAFRRLGLLLLLEVVLTPLFVLLVLRVPGIAGWELALLLAALCVETAPASTLAIVNETRSRGVFVKTLISAVALNNIACILLFEMAHETVRVASDPRGDAGVLHLLGTPLRQLASSGALGGAVGLLLIASTRKVVRRERLATASILAILLAAGLAAYLGVSALLTCMWLGVCLANVTPNKEEIGDASFADFKTAIFAVFFTLAGMELDFGYVLPAALVAGPVFLARAGGKLGAGWLSMRLAGATDRVRKNLGLALLPQAGVSVGLLLLVQTDERLDPDFRGLVLAVGLSLVLVNEIVGPVLTRVALVRSGDYGNDRARLIDFLHEENIVVDLRSDSMEAAIRQLADVLVRTNHLAIDSERLVASILERERAVSTCVGGGLAIPHGVLEEGEEIVGAMGISREGLDFDTPDGRPVHCMVLLATPPHQRARHLEVLAALARAVGTDPSVQRELFDARTPAHVYEILHAEEAEGFNYFLEDDAGDPAARPPRPPAPPPTPATPPVEAGEPLDQGTRR